MEFYMNFLNIIRIKTPKKKKERKKLHFQKIKPKEKVKKYNFRRTPQPAVTTTNFLMKSPMRNKQKIKS